MTQTNYDKVKEALSQWKPIEKAGLYSNSYEKFSTVDVIAIARCGFLEARTIIKRLRQEGALQ